MIFKQFFDDTSSTYTYLISSGNGREALIIDPVIENTDEYIKVLEELNLKLVDLHEALFIESSPGPVKYGASLLGLCEPDTRLPLAPISENTKLIVKNALHGSGLIKNY